MTAEDVIVAVRHEIKDEDEGNYRWEDPAMFRALTGAQMQFNVLRPDVFLQADGTMASPVVVTALNTPMPVHETYLEPLVWFVCGTILASDGDDEANAKRADAYVTRALNRLTGVG